MNEIEKLSESLLDGNVTGSWNQIMGYARSGHNSLFIYEQLLTPAMRYIGELWEDNTITVADEHLATSTCDILLSQYMLTRPEAKPLNRKALFFCIENEQHILGLKMVHALFSEQGWQSNYLGANLPLEYALHHANKWKPDVIGLSVSITSHLTKLSSYVKALEELSFHPTVLLGGRLTNKYDLRPYCSANTWIACSLPEIKDWLDYQPPRNGDNRYVESG